MSHRPPRENRKLGLPKLTRAFHARETSFTCVYARHAVGDRPRGVYFPRNAPTRESELGSSHTAVPVDSHRVRGSGPKDGTHSAGVCGIDSVEELVRTQSESGLHS